MLVDRQAEIRTKLRSLREVLPAEVAQVKDAEEQSMEDFVLGMDFALMEMESETLRKIDEAIQRLEDGTYGICSECDETISEARLKALPFATVCRDCQAQREDDAGRAQRAPVAVLRGRAAAPAARERRERQARRSSRAQGRRPRAGGAVDPIGKPRARQYAHDPAPASPRSRDRARLARRGKAPAARLPRPPLSRGRTDHAMPDSDPRSRPRRRAGRGRHPHRAQPRDGPARRRPRGLSAPAARPRSASGSSWRRGARRLAAVPGRGPARAAWRPNPRPRRPPTRPLDLPRRRASSSPCSGPPPRWPASSSRSSCEPLREPVHVDRAMWERWWPRS